MAKNWEFAAKSVWPILADAAMRRKDLTYADIARVINTNALSVRHVLGPILHYCLDSGLPLLTAVVVRANTGVPGDGLARYQSESTEATKQKVYEFDWGSVANPFQGFERSMSIESLVDGILDSPATATDVYRQIKDRGLAQQIFRRALLKAYGGVCAICGLSFSEALEAAHIVSWSEASDSEKIAPENGVLLCGTHHKLFDNDLIRLTEDYLVFHCSHYYPANTYGPADISATTRFHGKAIRLPTSPELRPSVALIRRRNAANEK